MIQPQYFIIENICLHAKPSVPKGVIRYRGGKL